MLSIVNRNQLVIDFRKSRKNVRNTKRGRMFYYYLKVIFRADRAYTHNYIWNEWLVNSVIKLSSALIEDLAQVIFYLEIGFKTLVVYNPPSQLAMLEKFKINRNNLREVYISILTSYIGGAWYLLRDYSTILLPVDVYNH